MYQNKLGQQGVQAVVNMNKIKFEPYGNLADQFFSYFNESSLTNQDPHSQVKNHETPGYEYPNEDDSRSTETNKISTILNFMPKILPGDETAKDINSLNSKQMEVFNVVHTWVEDYVKYNGIMLNTCT